MLGIKLLKKIIKKNSAIGYNFSFFTDISISKGITTPGFDS